MANRFRHSIDLKEHLHLGLTITTTQKPATDLSYLLAKKPDRCQSFELAFGQVHVFYPIAEEDRCTAALLLDLDPVA